MTTTIHYFTCFRGKSEIQVQVVHQGQKETEESEERRVHKELKDNQDLKVNQGLMES